MTDARPRSPAAVREADLADAIEAGLAGARVPALTAGVQRLMAVYRSGELPETPAMASRADAAAYAAYRMPATVAAAAAAISETRRSLPNWAPATLLDFGAGTGAVAWAVAAGLPSVESMTLLEQSPEAVRLGRAILAVSAVPQLQSATWQSWRLAAGAAPSATHAAGQPGGDQPRGGQPGGDQPRGDQPGGDQAHGELPRSDTPGADLATAAYVLGELTSAQQAALVGLAVGAAPAVLLIEPGTPAGHRRILTARGQLLAAGYQVAAPCPHQLSCPLASEGEWCHFGARLPRSAVHRQVKGADLAYEDEKFSYVAMIRPEVAGRPDWPAGRVVRRPQQRKGLVMLDVCARDGTSRRELISKSKGQVYKRARKTGWGDRFDSAG
jgi:ribosomal protein RSM22 (predicted rRNA methylase)